MPKKGNTNFVITNKELREYFELVETIKRIPKGSFHIVNQELLLDALFQKEFIEDFPFACKILRKNNNYMSMSNIEKIEMFLDIVENEGMCVIDSKKTFNGTISMSHFWKSNRLNIFLLLFESEFKEYYMKKYPNSYNLLLDEYKKYLNYKIIVEVNKRMKDNDNEDISPSEYNDIRNKCRRKI